MVQTGTSMYYSSFLWRGARNSIFRNVNTLLYRILIPLYFILNYLVPLYHLTLTIYSAAQQSLYCEVSREQCPRSSRSITDAILWNRGSTNAQLRSLTLSFRGPYYYSPAKICCISGLIVFLGFVFVFLHDHLYQCTSTVRRWVYLRYYTVDLMLLTLNNPFNIMNSFSPYRQCSHLNLLTIFAPRVDAQNDDDDGLDEFRFFFEHFDDSLERQQQSTR